MILFYYLINFVLVSGLVYLLWRWQAESALKKYFLPALILKLLCGILLIFYYQHYFGGGDAKVFQTQSNYVTEYARVSPASYLRLLLTRKYESETLRTSMIFYWYSNSYFMVMVLSFLNLITHNHLYLNSLYFSLFSFFGLWQLCQTLTRLNIKFKYPAVIAFLFFPSVVFWSSGVSKEAIYLGSLSWLISGVLRLTHKHYVSFWLQIITVLIAGYILWKIKFYYAALVFALLFAYALYYYLTGEVKIFREKKVGWLLFCVLLLTGGAIVSQWNVVFKLDYFFSQLMRSYTTLAERSAGKPMLYFPELEPTLYSIISHSPEAIFYAIFRPFVWEGESFYYRLAGIENMLILLLLLLTLVNLIRKFPIRLDLGVVVMLLYILVIAALIGLATPNIGSLSRYKTAVTPFLVFLLLRFNYPSGTDKWFRN